MSLANGVTALGGPTSRRRARAPRRISSRSRSDQTVGIPLSSCGSAASATVIRTGPVPPSSGAGDPLLARFQPIGLSLSKCYLQSEGKLNCVTCHDPHARASASRAEYDKICLNCHGGTRRLARVAANPGVPPVVCSVSPGIAVSNATCLRVAVDLGQHVRFSDHWIRIHSEDEAAATK